MYLYHYEHTYNLEIRTTHRHKWDLCIKTYEMSRSGDGSEVNPESWTQLKGSLQYCHAPARAQEVY